MNPVLLYTDTKSIQDSETILASAVETYQSIYNAIQAVGVTAPALSEIQQLILSAKKQSVSNDDSVFGIAGVANLGAGFIANYVKNKLVDQAMPYVVNGISWPSSKVAEIITLPDLTVLSTALQPVWGGNYKNIFFKGSIEYFKYLGLAANVVSAVDDADTQITNAFTYYTQNDTSTTLATEIQAVCTALNAYYGANSALKPNKEIITDSGFANGSGQRTIFTGIVLQGGNTFAIDMYFIRDFEKNNNTIMATML